MIIAVAAVVFSFAATVAWLKPSVKRSDIRVARVERGEVDATLQAGGTVVPRFEQVVSSPLEARVLRIDRRAGDAVRAGDALLTLDTGAAQLDAARLDERVRRRKTRARSCGCGSRRRSRRSKRSSSRSGSTRTILQYTSQQKAKLGESGLAAQQEVLAAAAAAKKCEIEIRQLEEALVRGRRSRDAQLGAAANDVAIARRERVESQRQLALAMMRADRAGVVTWIVPEAGATIRRGDVLARIADLSAFRVTRRSRTCTRRSCARAMRARVKLDDATSIGGTIENVDPRIVNGVVTFSVTLDEPAHPRLRNTSAPMSTSSPRAARTRCASSAAPSANRTPRTSSCCAVTARCA